MIYFEHCMMGSEKKGDEETTARLHEGVTLRQHSEGERGDKRPKRRFKSKNQNCPGRVIPKLTHL